MHLHAKLVVSTVIFFIAITLALGYFGLERSISGIQPEAPILAVASSTRQAELERGSFPQAQTVPIAPAPETAPLPPADPEKKALELPKIVFPKFPVPGPIPELPPSPAAPKIPAATPTPAPVSPAPLPEPAPQETAAESAVVNIICTPGSASPLKKSISGSGVIIDSRGIILTVAHVGHYFLLEDYPRAGNADCVIRTGSPAKLAYDAKLVYVSPTWVNDNAGALSESQPRGNGKNDFAFLAITASRTSAALPSSFPATPLARGAEGSGDDVSIGTYGAEFLSGSQIQSSLYPTFVDGSIDQVYTFGKNAVDVISVRGSIAAQSGSSGGGVFDSQGAFAGLITTSSLLGGTAQRTLYAITPDYIRAAFKSETGKDLDSYLGKSPSTLVQDFAGEIPGLAETVWDALN